VISDDGTEIAVETVADNHPGPTLVFVHGWTFSSRFWHYQRALAERWRLVLIDHRGHGESAPGPREHRTIDQLGRDLRAVIADTCAGREVVLVGHSMGGMTIMSLAAQHPDLFGAQVRGVALIDTSAQAEPDNASGVRGKLTQLWARQFEATLEQMSADPARAEQKRRSGSRLSLAISRGLNLGRRPAAALTRFTEALSAATTAEVVGDFWKTLREHDITAGLAALGNVPTLVVVGDRDRLTPPRHAHRIASGVPGARLLELRDAGHCPPLEQPNTVNQALRQLVEQAISKDDGSGVEAVAPARDGAAL
jgi:pimeloyl-ACP methyl ester carboxylesterase